VDDVTLAGPHKNATAGREDRVRPVGE
jgi:hypothetical protein